MSNDSDYEKSSDKDEDCKLERLRVSTAAIQMFVLRRLGTVKKQTIQYPM